jgi:signal transduction histidine kinase/DNA-binding response OmpR family regulator
MTAISGLFFSRVIQKESAIAITNNLKFVDIVTHSNLRGPKTLFSNIHAAVQELLDKNESQEAISRYLTQSTELLQGAKGVIAVYAYIRGELMNVYVPIDETYVPQERPWYKQAHEGDDDAPRAISYTNVGTSHPITSLAQKVYGKNGDYYGVLAMDIKLVWLEEYAESQQFTKGRYAIVLNQDLQILVHKGGHQGVWFEDLGPDYARIAAMLREGKEVSAVNIRDIDGVKTVLFFKQLYNGWFIGTANPAASYYANVYSSLFALMVLGIALSAILSYALLRLSAAKERSERESKSKSSFLTVTSHEIRTPISAIMGIAQIELQKEGLPEEYAKAFDKIYTSGNTLLGIINDILDLSKIESGKLELNPAEYDIPSLINDVMQCNAIRIGSKNINFLIEPDSSLPSKFYGDELRLRQVLNNLLSNAIKYTDEGFVKLSVNHLERGEETFLRFSVEDSGQGLMPEDKANLFSEYRRFNAAANRSTEGTGIGLSITKCLVEMMGGTITVESQYGKGSIFIVEIIQKNVSCEAIGADISEKLKKFTYAADKMDRQRKVSEIMPYGKVLVVDDVETNLYVAKGLLAPWKINVETAASGFEALDLVKAGKVYDIIFMDHMMPKMDGMETTQKIRALGYGGAIVALTANALIGNDEMFRNHGFDSFVPKPIDVRRLCDALNKFVRDRYPDEAKKYSAIDSDVNAVYPLSVQPQTMADDPQMLKIFRRDAEAAVIALREAMKNDDIKQIAAAAHSMKPILANAGEGEKSQMALTLEKAGRDGDRGYVNANVEAFIQALEELIEAVPRENETAGGGDEGITEDTAYLAEQLKIVKSACDDYDEAAAYQAINRLKEKTWKKETVADIEKIYDMLFLHSDFEGAGERAMGACLRVSSAIASNPTCLNT